MTSIDNMKKKTPKFLRNLKNCSSPNDFALENKILKSLDDHLKDSKSINKNNIEVIYKLIYYFSHI